MSDGLKSEHFVFGAAQFFFPSARLLSGGLGSKILSLFGVDVRWAGRNPEKGVQHVIIV